MDIWTLYPTNILILWLSQVLYGETRQCKDIYYLFTGLPHNIIQALRQLSTLLSIPIMPPVSGGDMLTLQI